MAHDSEGNIFIGATGVEIADIQTVLGSSRNDIGALIENGNINKWARLKPFRYNAPGFPLDKTQPTPETRCPERMTRLLAANFGLSIPKYNATNFKTHYSDQWTYLRPRGLSYNEHFRFPDFDGYVHTCWQLAPVGDRGVYTIFNGYFGVPNSVVFAGDNIQFSIQCAEDPDGGIQGLLYPYSFLRDMQSDDDLSKYYMGIALLDSQSRLWVITGERMDSHHSMYDVDASLSTTIPTNVADGALKAMPILASNQYPNWDNAPGMGYFISLDGAYLSLTKQSSSRLLVIDVDVQFINNGVTLNFSVRNQSSNAVTNGPDIHVNDWASSYPAYLAARAYTSAYADFRTANNNSTTIASNATVTWSKRFNNVTEDDFGSYAEYMRFVLCVRIGTTAYVDIFIADE